VSSPQTLLPLLAQIGLLPLGHGEVHTDRPIRHGGPEEQFADLVRVVSARTVIEVGAWQGRSAIAWSSALAAAGDDWLVMCLDTWLGSLEMWEQPSGDWSRERLFVKDGYPSVFATFRSNVRRAGIGDRVIAIPLDSAQGLELLARNRVVADIIYVDAAHDFMNALRDIRQALQLINTENPRSLVLCDDFMRQWAGVREAVFVSARETGSTIMIKHAQAALVPPTAGTALVEELRAFGWKEVPVETEIDGAGFIVDPVSRLTRELRDSNGIVMKANESLRVRRAELQALKETRRVLREQLREMRVSKSNDAPQMRQELITVRAELAAVLNSRSWKMTAWIRKVRSMTSVHRNK